MEMYVWDQVNLVFYNIIPFLIMIGFNLMLIINLKRKLSIKSESLKSRSKKFNLTVSLIIISFLFLVMTAPGTIMFGYFYDGLFARLDKSIAYLVDDISFLNHASLFFISFVSIRKFRKIVIQIIIRRKFHLKDSSFSASSSKDSKSKINCVIARFRN